MSNSQHSSSSLSLNNMHILVTGGSGYIGSHTVIELLNNGAEVTVVDSLVNSNYSCIERVEKLTGKKLNYHQIDIRNTHLLETQVFYPLHQSNKKFDCCIHFAALKAVGESVAKPLEYYDNNIVGTISLLKLLNIYKCPNIVFSSSATVYGLAEVNPIDEKAPLSTTNPYGETKLMIERMLKDMAAADSNWKVVLLRYFNPIGADKSGDIGEDPNGIPNNLLPFVLQVAVGRREKVAVFGNDYDTKDGTGVRDYIHVIDLAKGHVAAITKGIMGNKMKTNCEAYNLGTGSGISVLEMISYVEQACGHKIPYEIVARRKGDIATCFANPSKANTELEWKTELSVQEGVNDSWNWQKKNPQGFPKNTKHGFTPDPQLNKSPLLNHQK